MPQPFYVTIEGNKSGKIDGSCDVKPHEKKILAQGLEHNVSIPNDPQTGLPSGKRVHHPLTITKIIDASSAPLMGALTAGEHMKSVLLEFVRTDANGAEAVYYTIKLEDAALVSIRPYVPNTLLAENSQLGHMEDVSLTYKKITWDFKPDKKVASDDWTAPKS